ncbi:MAG: hypothetical protein AAE986_00795 [Thermoplasmataceae archaeon]
MTDMSVEVTFPKEFKMNLGAEILKMPLEKIKTNSFNSAEIPFGRLVNDIFSDIPIASLRGKYGMFQLRRKRLTMVLFLKGGLVRPSSVKKVQKFISDKELRALNVDANYLYGSVLGTLGLSNQIMKIEINSNFEKKGIFSNNFNNKVKDDFLKKNELDEVWGISFRRRLKGDKLSTEFTYEFEHKDIDEVRVTESRKTLFSPFDLASIIDETLKDINKKLSEW